MRGSLSGGGDMFKRGGFLLLLSMVLISCTDRLPERTRVRTRAPQVSQELGIVVKGIDDWDLEKFLEEYPKSSIRVLSVQHKMYEIYGASVRAIRAFFKNAEIYPNQFIRSKVPRAQSKSNPPSSDSSLGCRAMDYEMSGSISFYTGDGQITQKKVGTFSLPQFRLGQRVTIEINQIVTGDVKPLPESQIQDIKWGFVEIPKTSQISRDIYSGKKVSFTLDNMGTYELSIWVTTKSHLCGFLGQTFTVTSNPEYEGPQGASSFKDFKRDFIERNFWHLLSVKNPLHWSRTPTSSPVVAVLDTGVHYNHPFLRARIAQTGDIPGNGIDDDGNGFIDDSIGYDFENGDNYPFDDAGHGTHVSGLIAGSGFGMSENARVLPVKVLNEWGGGDEGSFAAGIYYAVDTGAKIINMSLATTNRSTAPLLEKAIEYAREKGVVVVVAAGNGNSMGVGVDIEKSPLYPASLRMENLLTVAALHSSATRLTSYSNFSSHLVQIATYGGDLKKGLKIRSTYYQNARGLQFISMSGTSMATPIISGAIAKLLSYYPHLSPLEAKDILLKSADRLESLKGQVQNGSVLNVQSAMEEASSQEKLLMAGGF
ncbi:MAG: hypothetical protein D6797_06450 [Bdellovibrio sp.]|nr:MAG: hypothetical protein D6797_06450 [Bdellovibrio sp.]